MRAITWYLAFVVHVSCLGQAKSVRLPEIEPLQLAPIIQLDSLVHPETSGIVKSRLYEDVFWLHSDSGDETRIVPIDSSGRVIQSYRYGTSTGQYIGDAVNMDWEDILTDDRGNLIVADFGNNCNCRRDLVFYFIRESDPIQRNNRVFKKVFFSYPDQESYPAAEDDYNYDAEGAFYAQGKIYILSKNRSNTYTKLYRLESESPYEMNELTLLDSFDIRGRVTAADASEDGRRIAVLTYGGVWMFEAKQADHFFDGRIWWLPLTASGMEGICFDGDRLLISKEPGAQLFELPISELVQVRD